MQKINCSISDSKVRFAKQIAERLHGNITMTSDDSASNAMSVGFNNDKEAHLFDRFMFIMNQPFA